MGVRNVSGDIEFRGAMSTKGTNGLPFTLPKAVIQPTGSVTVQVNGETPAWSDAQCFTSLEGASFLK